MHQSVQSDAGHYFMTDIRGKRPTRRRAVAVGEISEGMGIVGPLPAHARDD